MLSNISKKALIGENVQIGDFVKIYDNVVIADNVTIQDHCIIGLPNDNATGPLTIGEGSIIRSHTIVYEGSTLEKGVKTGHSCLIRENNQIGRGVQLGSFAELEGYIKIGNWSRVHSKVQLSRRVEIGKFCYLFPRVQTSDDPLPPSHVALPPKIGDLSVIAINSLILSGVNIGRGCFIGANTVVKDDVKDLECVMGSPAKKVCKINQLRDLKNKIRHPWHNHFRDGFPEEAQGELDAEIAKI